MRRFQQYLTALADACGALSMALCGVWPSYTIPLYADEASTPLDAAMSPLELALLGALPSLGAMFGTALIVPLMHRLGKKRTGIVLSLHIVLSWSAISATRSPLVVLIARFVAGVAQGGYCVFGPAFVSEIAESSIRGTLASAPMALCYAGTISSYLFGWFLGYTTILYTNIAISVFCFVLQSLVVESPVYLLQIGKEMEARKSIARYRGMSEHSEVVLEELSRLKRQLSPAVELMLMENPDFGRDSAEGAKEKMCTEEAEYGKETKRSPWITLFSNPVSRRAMFIVISTFTLEIFMGMLAIEVNAKTLFTLIAPGVSPNLCSVLLAVVLLGGSITTVMLTDRAGRRILIIGSSAFVAIWMTILGVLLQTELGPTWMKAVFFLLNCFTFNCGAGTIPFVLLAELFLPEVHRFALLVAVEWMWFMSFSIIAAYNFLVALIKIHGVFYFFASFALANVVFCYFFVPETKGLNCEQIQEVLRNR